MTDFDEFDEFEKEILEKIDNGEELSSEEVEECITQYEIVDTIYVDKLDWHNDTEAVLEIGGRFFSFSYLSALTENQVSEYPEQLPAEVVKEVRTIPREVWVRKKKTQDKKNK